MSLEEFRKIYDDPEASVRQAGGPDGRRLRVVDMDEKEAQAVASITNICRTVTESIAFAYGRDGSGSIGAMSGRQARLVLPEDSETPCIWDEDKANPRYVASLKLVSLISGTHSTRIIF